MKQTTVSLLIHLYIWLLRLYPSGFRDESGDEMTIVFNDVLADVKMESWSNTMILLARGLHDSPGLVWREHPRARKGIQMNQNLTWRPLTARELIVAGKTSTPQSIGFLAVSHRPCQLASLIKP
jgi:hypothetical protein